MDIVYTSADKSSPWLSIPVKFVAQTSIWLSEAAAAAPIMSPADAKEAPTTVGEGICELKTSCKFNKTIFKDVNSNDGIWPQSYDTDKKERTYRVAQNKWDKQK